MPPLAPKSNAAQHSLGHINCPACEALKRSIVRTGELGTTLFSVAADLWMEVKVQTVSARTAWDYKMYLRALLRFFSELPLGEIHIGHIVEYRKMRQITAGPARINHEIDTLSQIMKMAGLWDSIARHYKPMRLPHAGPGQAFLEEEADWLFEVASRKKRWKVAYLCSLVSANTTCGPGEIRNLRMRDIDLKEGVIHIVKGAKNQHRLRAQPLNTDALWAMEELVQLAYEKGSTAPDHYLLTHRAHVRGSKPDPTRPMGSWKKAWYALRTEAGQRYPKLKTIRMYDLRHHAITKMLEDPSISEQTVKDIAGQVSKKILDRYSHIRLARKQAALKALEGLRKEPKAAAPFIVSKRVN